MSKRKKVYWDYAERETVVNKALELRRAGSLLSTRELLHEAQNALPKERQRPEHGVRHDPKLLAQFQEFSSRGKEPPTQVVIPHTPAPRETTLDESVAAFAEVVADSIAKHLRQALLGRMGGIVLSAANAAAAAKVRLRKKKVIVVGPLDKQFALLETEYKEIFDIRLFDKESRGPVLGTAAHMADYVVLWTNFVSHEMQEAIPRDKLVLVTGGMDAIRNKLEELYMNS